MLHSQHATDVSLMFLGTFLLETNVEIEAFWCNTVSPNLFSVLRAYSDIPTNLVGEKNKIK